MVILPKRPKQLIRLVLRVWLCVVVCVFCISRSSHSKLINSCNTHLYVGYNALPCFCIIHMFCVIHVFLCYSCVFFYSHVVLLFTCFYYCSHVFIIVHVFFHYAGFLCYRLPTTWVKWAQMTPAMCLFIYLDIYL